MKHAEQLVDLVDENGVVTGTKQRQLIDKATDLYHTVFNVLRTPDHKLILSKIPQRTDLPNLYFGLLGATAATIRRHDETAAAAAKRAANDELYITDAQLTHLGDRYLVLPDGHRKYMSVFVGTYPVPTDYSHTDIEDLVSFDRHTLQETLENHKDQFSLTFLAIWQQYQQDILPL